MKFKLLLLVTLFSIVFAQQEGKKCKERSTCSECMLASGECYWCADPGFPYDRCNLKPILQGDQNCKLISIEDNIKVSEVNNAFSSTIQVVPQEVSFKLRPFQSQQFKISVKPARDYPVQLYYLMDMSKSMEDDQEKLKSLGKKIAEEINKITKNYQLAFGSFVDKTVSPFTQVDIINHPCDLDEKFGKKGPCDPTFGYRHNFNFDSNATKFEEAVAQQKISGNLDTPEGGFDGLMQVSVCDTMLGWKNMDQARRIVIFVTDASPHIAGDGKIGGITAPNDGLCHLLDKDTYKIYDKSNEMDYPSISQLKVKMKQNKVVPILAVTSDVFPVYQKLAEQWKDTGAAIGKLEFDSSNIVDLIRDSYKKIATTVRLIDDSNRDRFTVRYKGSCSSAVDNECQNVQIEEQVDFTVTITALDCKSAKNDSFKITIPGFGDVKVNIEMICDCPCEREAGTPNADICNKNGTSKCGICYCNPGRYGVNCDCDNKAQADTSLCKIANSTDDRVCSGFGICVCGQCECIKRSVPEERIYGKYCQCNNFGCDRYQGKICGGPERGVCDCQECKCKEAFQGANCGAINCTIGAKNCRKDNQICSNNGVCACDTCVCSFGYKGKYCENCVSCPGKCANVKDCVFCQAFKKGKDEVCSKCNLNIRIVNKTEEKCSYLDDDNCYVIFSFEDNEFAGTLNETILVQKERKCIVIVPTDPPILAIVLGTIGGIVLLGLILLLLWKLLITAYDNYEYQRFERERMKSQWENAENPIYKPSKQQFQNPTYAGNN
ncbi:integrin beta-1-A isoform X2 [Hydra vulgaris]|uniref:Integrin beta n=1 Tax=Hydra vulgaris TaxID=6087 RepID=A0ABM4CT26_HYDVU